MNQRVTQGGVRGTKKVSTLLAVNNSITKELSITKERSDGRARIAFKFCRIFLKQPKEHCLNFKNLRLRLAAKGAGRSRFRAKPTLALTLNLYCTKLPRVDAPIIHNEKETHRGASRHHSHIRRCSVGKVDLVEHHRIVAGVLPVEPAGIVTPPRKLAGLESAPA